MMADSIDNETGTGTTASRDDQSLAYSISKLSSNDKESMLLLTFEDIKYAVKVSALSATITKTNIKAGGDVQILKGITGAVRSGEIMAIMGPSGSGKSTLLDVLTYRNKGTKRHESLSGRVCLNGHKIDREIFSSLCSYVPQEDALWSALTVRENLLYAARLYHPSVAEPSVHKEIVDGALECLGLLDCANVKIGNFLIKGVSGGQRRRTSIGVELVSGRRILFLDEPTSGLDAASASSIMKLLKDLAIEQNLIVVASIHQPSSHVFYSFDKLLMLSMGHTAYMGDVEAAYPFFAKHRAEPTKQMNPADWLLELTNADFTSKAEVQELLEIWKESEEATMMQENVIFSREESFQEHKKPSSLVDTQKDLYSILGIMWSLLTRSWLNYLRDPASYLLRLGNIAFMSLFLGAVYSKLSNSQTDIMDRIFLIQWGLAFNSYLDMVALPAFALERNSVNKEFGNGMYPVYQYVISTAASQAPFVALSSLLAVTFFYWIAGPLNELFSRYVQYCILMFGQLFYIESLAVLLATIIKDDVLALSIFGSIVSVLFIFNGFFVSVELMPDWLSWLQYLSPFKYTWEAQAQIIFRGLTFEPCMADTPQCFGETGEDVLDFFSSGEQDINAINVWGWFGVLLALALGLRLAFGLALVMQHK